MAIKKYRLTKPPMSHMLDDDRLTFEQRGVLGYLSTQITRSGYPVVTVLNLPPGGMDSHAQMIEALDRLVETDWAEVVE